MTEIQRIADQLRRAFEGDAWHGPSVREVLANVLAQQAASRPVPQAHTIWEIVRHITAWHVATRQRIDGEMVELTGEQDWPPVRDTSSSSWEVTLAALEGSFRDLMQTVAGLTDAQLSHVVPGRTHTIYFLLHGIIQHDLYHGGQIALLAKA